MLFNSDHCVVFELLNNRDTPNLYLAASGDRLYFGTRRSGLSPLSEAGLERVDIAEYLECCRVRVYEDMTKLLVNHPDELVANEF